jgi:hypothetical protein
MDDYISREETLVALSTAVEICPNCGARMDGGVDDAV